MLISECVTTVSRRPLPRFEASTVIKGRSLTRSLVHGCTTCRRYNGAPFRGPPPPPLPKFRVEDDPAFTYTGVDFAGPIFVRSEVSSNSVKVWICVSTCLVTRAVHLDIVCDLSAGTFLWCLKQFAARRDYLASSCLIMGKPFKLQPSSFMLSSRTQQFKST